MLFSVYAEGLFYLYTNSFFNPVNFPCLFIEGKCKYIQRAVKPHTKRGPLSTVSTFASMQGIQVYSQFFRTRFLL